MTVPPKFRKVAPSGCIPHKAALSDREVEDREGFRVTTPLRTLLDAAEAGVSLKEMRGAAREAIRRGLVRRSVLERAVRSLDVEESLARDLARACVSR